MALETERTTWLPAYGVSLNAIVTALLIVRIMSIVKGTGGKAGLDDAFIVISYCLGVAALVPALIGKVWC